MSEELKDRVGLMRSDANMVSFHILHVCIHICTCICVALMYISTKEDERQVNYIQIIQAEIEYGQGQHKAVLHPKQLSKTQIL